MDEKCSFCGESVDKVKKLLSSTLNKDTYICDKCIVKCNDYIKDTEIKISNIDPLQIKNFLDRFVIEQENAKKILSCSIFSHLVRINSNEEIEKSNILLIGPSGCGKTFIITNLCKTLKVSYTICDANVFTESGYVGEDVSNIIFPLLLQANGDIKKAENGIVIIDEIDKKSKKGSNPSITRDVSGEGVQNALLKMIEGTTVNIPDTGGRKHPGANFIKINTKNILFIFLGAFIGLKDIISRRMGNNVIGFNKSLQSNNIENDILRYVEPEDLIEYGIIPELIGRIPIISVLHDLNKESLKRILIEPENSIVKQYKLFFNKLGIDLIFTEEAIDIIAEKAVKSRTGARSLRNCLEKILVDYILNINSIEEKLEIDKDIVIKKLNL